jgi:hypothetical protein
MRKIYLLILGVFCVQFLNAQFSQVWDESFAHTTSVNFSNESREIVVNSSGFIFVLADATSNIDINGNLTNNTYHYAVVVKYDAAGNFIKKYTIDVTSHLTAGFDNHSAFGLELDGSGNIYAGYTIEDPFSGFDIRLAKFDSNLNLLWSHKYNPVSEDYGVDMVSDIAGNVFLLVKSVDGANTHYSILKNDGLNSNLVVLQSYDPNVDVLRAMVVDDLQNVYATGHRLVGGYKNVLTTSVTNAGILRWNSVYNGGSVSRDDFGTDINFGIDGFLYVTGTSDQGGTRMNDMLILQHDPQGGKKLWITFHHQGPNDNGMIVSNRDTNFVYVGSLTGNTVVLTRIDNDLGTLSGSFVYTPIPDRPHTSITSVSLNDLKISSNNNFYVTGTIVAVEPSGANFSAGYLAKLIPLPRSRNAFRLQYSEPALGDAAESYAGIGIAFNYLNDDLLWLRDKILDFSTHDREVVYITDYNQSSPIRTMNPGHMDNILVYPNPANQYLNISSEDKIRLIEVFDLTGKKVINSIPLTSAVNAVLISYLKNGIYYVRVHTDEKIVSQKFIKE